MVKKGHKRKNWTERWFELTPEVISYYESEDLLEKKGYVSLDLEHNPTPNPNLNP
uniref:PH domain-containing protein n=1 Tax=Astyanax mexicanus TaxID=7994 RepID=A0A3B1J422_ASTMX